MTTRFARDMLNPSWTEENVNDAESVAMCVEAEKTLLLERIALALEELVRKPERRRLWNFQSAEGDRHAQVRIDHSMNDGVSALADVDNHDGSRTVTRHGCLDLACQHVLNLGFHSIQLPEGE